MYWQIIYVTMFVMVLLYGIFKKRELDLIYIYFLSTTVYFFPVVLGEFQSFVFNADGTYTYYPEALYYKTYIVLIINTFICFIWMIIRNLCSKKNRQCSSMYYLNDYANLIVIGTEALLLILNTRMILRLRYLIFTNRFDKTILLNNMSLLDTLCLNMSYFVFILAFVFNMRWRVTTRLFAIILMIFPFMLSRRSEIVLGMIAITYVWINRQNYSSIYILLINKKKTIIAVLFFGIAVFLSKGIMNSIVQGNWQEVKIYLEKKNTLIDSFLYSEPNIITSTLNGVLEKDVRVDGESYKHVVLSFFPFIETLFSGKLSPSDFYTLYQPIVYPEIKGWGAANCFLAEAYSNGGWIMLFVVVNCLCAMLLLLERGIKRCNNWGVKTALLASMPYLTFYIHRNTVYYIIRTVRIYIYLAIVLNIIYLILKNNKFGRENICEQEHPHLT